VHGIVATFGSINRTVAEVERLLAAQCTKVRHACAQAEGKTFGTVPFAYRRNADGGLDQQPGEIEIVHEIVAMRQRGTKLRRHRCVPHHLERADTTRWPVVC
jgi:hypothetical protein